jgi:predicted DNA-binding transcriptional regulator AlpA
MATSAQAAEAKAAFSISEFCRLHGICRASFYNAIKRGDAPRLMRVGSRRLVSAEAAADWRREREAAACEKPVELPTPRRRLLRRPV